MERMLRLRYLRLKRGWTQRRLAEEAGMSVSVISQIESGRFTRPYAQTLRRLADALGWDDDPAALMEEIAVGLAPVESSQEEGE
jgi:transcriptional regulator with XRE-family HTH domain